MRENKLKTLHYRRAILINKELTLQQVLAQLLSNYSLVSQRWEDLDQAGNHKRLINDHVAQMGMEFGTFLAFEGGTNRMLMEIEANAPSMDVTQIAPPQSSSGLRREFLDSILYYGVRGNHVVLLQSAGLRERQLESHLNWLISQTGGNEHVRLVDEPNPDLQAILRTVDIKKMRLRSTVASDNDLDQELNEQGSSSLIEGGRGVLRSILGTDSLARLPMNQIYSDDLVVDVTVTYDRSISSVGQTVLNRLARLVVDEGWDGTELIIPGVGKVSGDQLKLSNQISVQTNGGVVNPNDLFPKMQQWVSNLLTEERINDEQSD